MTTAFTLIILALIALLAWSLRAQARLRAELEAARLSEREARVGLEYQKSAGEAMKDAFQAYAGEAMGKNNTEFLKLAEEALKNVKAQMQGDLNSRATAVESLVRPLTEQIDQLRRSSEELGRSQKGGEEGVRELMKSLAEGQEKLRLQTQGLAGALSNNSARGAWGELVLERLLEWAGMREGVHYSTQVVAGADQSVKPDFILHLPGERDVVVDSKAVLDSYLQATQEADPARRAELLQAHARHLRGTIDSLAKKAYSGAFPRSPDFVVLFLPADVFLASAAEQDPELFERAFHKKIILATPSSFMAMLKIVERSWQESRMAENAREISRQGQQVMDRLMKFTEHLAKMGRDLENSVKSYNSMYGSLKSMVFPAVKRLRDMEVKPSRELEEKNLPKAVEELPRYKDGTDETAHLEE